MRIQHNIMAMNAYRNYNTNTKALSGNLEKLSSGYKINRAGDDAAGLAISEKMRAQITGLDAAQKNVKDGISLVKTAEGAMQEIQDMLNRMDYLATQSANGTYQDDVDRENLQKEVTALKTEINRIADSANFNGIKLLDGSQSAAGAGNGSALKLTNVTTRVDQAVTAPVTASFEINLDGWSGKLASGSITGTFSLKVGDASITISVTGATGAEGVTFNSTASFAGGASAVTINGVKYSMALTNGVLSFTAAASGAADADFNVSLTAKSGITASEGAKVNSKTQNVVPGLSADSGVQATANFELTQDVVKGGSITIKAANGQEKTFTFDADTDNMKLSDSTGTTLYVKELLDENGKLSKDALEKVAHKFTVLAKADSTVAGSWSVGNEGTTITFQSLSSKFNVNTDASKVLDLSTTDKVQAAITGKVGTNSSGVGNNGLTLQIGDTADSYNLMSVQIGDMHVSALGIGSIDISSQTGAQSAIAAIKGAINNVSSVRGDLGAIQNRLEHTGNNLSVMAENIQDAESTIRDTDVADEMMKYVKNNILVQSAQAMLAQANQVPQGVLQLLG